MFNARSFMKKLAYFNSCYEDMRKKHPSKSISKFAYFLLTHFIAISKELQLQYEKFVREFPRRVKAARAKMVKFYYKCLLVVEVLLFDLPVALRDCYIVFSDIIVSIGEDIAWYWRRRARYAKEYAPMISLFKSILLTFAQVIILFALLILVSILVIGLYHTSILAIGSLWPFIFSLILPAITLILAFRVFLHAHPVHSLLSLITVFFNVVVIYLAVQAEFLAFVFLIVYVGAIAILFLFVIMLLNVKELTAISGRTYEKSQMFAAYLAVPLSFLLITSFLTAIYSLVSKTDVVAFAIESTSLAALTLYVTFRFFDILIFSDLLYTYYSLGFMLIALLLLTAMLGAIILATSATEENVTIEEATGITPARPQNGGPAPLACGAVVGKLFPCLGDELDDLPNNSHVLDGYKPYDGNLVTYRPQGAYSWMNNIRPEPSDSGLDILTFLQNVPAGICNRSGLTRDYTNSVTAIKYVASKSQGIGRSVGQGIADGVNAVVSPYTNAWSLYQSRQARTAQMWENLRLRREALDAARAQTNTHGVRIREIENEVGDIDQILAREEGDELTFTAARPAQPTANLPTPSQPVITSTQPLSNSSTPTQDLSSTTAQPVLVSRSNTGGLNHLANLESNGEWKLRPYRQPPSSLSSSSSSTPLQPAVDSSSTPARLAPNSSVPSETPSGLGQINDSLSQFEVLAVLGSSFTLIDLVLLFLFNILFFLALYVYYNRSVCTSNLKQAYAFVRSQVISDRVDFPHDWISLQIYYYHR